MKGKPYEMIDKLLTSKLYENNKGSNGINDLKMLCNTLK